MSYDFKKLAQEKKDALLADLQTLVAIDSSRNLAAKTDEYPLGPGPAKALETFLGFAKRDGFPEKNFDNLAGRVEFGPQDASEILGVVGHLDEVPAGEGWTTDPFKVTKEGDRLYGRGVADDKGPTLAAYYAMLILKEQGFKPSKGTQFIVGTDEENDWTGINHYLETEKSPDMVFSPDAEFPIINGEKGIATFELKFKGIPEEGSDKLLSFKAGLAPNMVPQTATAKVYAQDIATIANAFSDFIATNDLDGSVETQGNEATITLIGHGAHGSEPELGRNAATFLAVFLQKFDFAGRDREYIDMIADILHEDFDGKKLKVNFHDDLMGELSAAPDVYDYENGNATVLVNIRYPQGITPDDIIKKISDNFGDKVDVSVVGHAQGPHYVPGSDPLVKTLLDVYERQTGKKGHETIIGGGTYGRIFERGVAYGAQPEDQENVMHQPNEYMLESALIDSIAIYAEAIYELTK